MVQVSFVEFFTAPENDNNDKQPGERWRQSRIQWAYCLRGGGQWKPRWKRGREGSWTRRRTWWRRWWARCRRGQARMPGKVDCRYRGSLQTPFTLILQPDCTSGGWDKVVEKLWFSSEGVGRARFLGEGGEQERAQRRGAARRSVRRTCQYFNDLIVCFVNIIDSAQFPSFRFYDDHPSTNQGISQPARARR